MIDSIRLARSEVEVAIVCLLLLFGAGCTTPSDPLQDFEQVSPATRLEPPNTAAERAANYPADQVSRGKYLVKLLGCAICHTDGALIGEPDYRLNLAGSRIGIAYSSPLVDEFPGVIYAPNLTPDAETGIGKWSQDQLARSLRGGESSHGRQLLAVMPWPTYALITDPDTQAISAYLFSLTPVRHKVPANVSPGNKAEAPFVYFGVYRSIP